MRVAAIVAGLVAMGTGAIAVEPVFYGQAALKDEIISLPNAPQVNFKMFSGYIPVAHDREMFYWFVESANDAAKDPILLWTNGGPGCSGLGGFLSEQGPFYPTKDGSTLVENEHAWNKIANMVFIEQPAGVGFSTAPSNYTNYTDISSAVDMHKFVTGFFDKFQSYKNNDFYITSESYGGHYMPFLAKEIAQQADVPNFRGVKLGNPITFMESRNYGEYGTYYGHQLYPKQLWDAYDTNQCHTLANAGTTTCTQITDTIDDLLQGLDPYALDFPVCKENGAAQMGQIERLHFLRKIKGNGHRTLRGYEPCLGNWGADYLNRAEVQKAIHVQGTVQWDMCSNHVGQYYSQDDVNQNVVPIWQWLLQETNGRYLIYSGDDDSVCATLGTQQFIWDMGYAIHKTWAPWMVDDQVAGFHVEWDTAKSWGLAKLALVTVHGAGHMVPQTQPVRSLELLRMFLSGEIL